MALASVAALALSVAVLAWRGRVARAREEEARLQHHSRIAADGADLLTGLWVALETAREARDEDVVRAALVDARSAIGSATRLLHATLAYATGEEPAGMPTADGVARLAVSVARAKACRVLVRGRTTELRLRGSSNEAVSLLAETLGRLWDAPGGSSFITVDLRETDVAMSRPAPACPELGRLEARARDLGWALYTHANGTSVSIVVRPS